MKKTHVLKVAIFAVIFILLLNLINPILSYTYDIRNYQMMGGFYEEEENSLDAVYIGSSTCYAFWNPLTSWNEYGIAVYPYSCNAQPFEVAEYMIAETRKNQPDAVYIVNIKMLDDDGIIGIDRLHYMLDAMPFSKEKVELINYLVKSGGYSWGTMLELYFPIIRFHSRWDELTKEDLNVSLDGLKGTSYYDAYLQTSIDASPIYVKSDAQLELSEEALAPVDSLLEYCEENDVKILFVTVPQVRDSEEQVQELNAMAEYISDQGFDVLSLVNEPEEVGLDLTSDLYNERHTNIHGSIKFTRYVSEYLIDNYGFEDKRGEEAYSSWDEAFEEYKEIIEPWVLDIELDGEHRDYDLERPVSMKIVEKTQGACLTWNAVENADGYAVYRKCNNKWELLSHVQEPTYLDSSCEEGTTYVYTVVPYSEEGGEKYYGNFSYLGMEFEL